MTPSNRDEGFGRARRRQVNERIEVIDTVAERVLGVVVDLSESGMMILSPRLLPEDALFQLRIALNFPDGRRHALDLGSQRLWAEPAQRPGEYWIGFRFIDVAPGDLALLRVWVGRPGGSYV